MEIALALSGGGSRAMAFHLGCLRALHDRGVLERVSILSSISGGSVIGALYSYRPELGFPEFEQETKNALRKGFKRDILLHLLNPSILLPTIGTNIVGRLGHFTRWKLEPPQRMVSRTDAFDRTLAERLYGGRLLTGPVREGLGVVIGASELATGTAFRFGNHRSGGSRCGEIVNNELPVSLAVAASAAYPLLLPALDRSFLFRKGEVTEERRVILTDGGVYDNLGVTCLEPGRTSAISTHAFSPDYIIACNASAGAKAEAPVPWGFVSRIKQTFGVIHRRVQNQTMHQLHAWKTSGALKGFILPYLGQDDSRLPLKLPNFIPREEVENYPTDFSPMSDEWIVKLSLRGEQLTRSLLQYYVPEL